MKLQRTLTSFEYYFGVLIHATPINFGALITESWFLRITILFIIFLFYSIFLSKYYVLKFLGLENGLLITLFFCAFFVKKFNIIQLPVNKNKITPASSFLQGQLPLALELLQLRSWDVQKTKTGKAGKTRKTQNSRKTKITRKKSQSEKQ